MIRYKTDILAALKAAGYSTYKLRQDQILGESTIQKLRTAEPISWDNLDTVCGLLGCQPGDIIERV